MGSGSDLASSLSVAVFAVKSICCIEKLTKIMALNAMDGEGSHAQTAHTRTHTHTMYFEYYVRHSSVYLSI